jgi:hypothetical protein
MKLKWTKADGFDGWTATGVNFQARVWNPKGPLGFCHWSVLFADRPAGSGGTSSLVQSKRSAEHEVERMTASR